MDDDETLTGSRPPLRFLVDAMLGNVARDLRLLGYDAEYAGDRPDAEILRICRADRRTLVTRDRQLARRSDGSLLLCEQDPRRQVVEVLSRVGAEDPRPFSRCTRCNGMLRNASPGGVACEVPDHVANTAPSFRSCGRCGRIYWPGTHLIRLETRVGGILRSLLRESGQV